jgi:hypothetical protein
MKPSVIPFQTVPNPFSFFRLSDAGRFADFGSQDASFPQYRAQLRPKEMMSMSEYQETTVESSAAAPRWVGLAEFHCSDWASAGAR